MVISSRKKAFPILALYLLLFDNRIGPNRDLGREAYATESRKSIQWSMEEGTVLYVRLFLQPLLQACWQKKRDLQQNKKKKCGKLWNPSLFSLHESIIENGICQDAEEKVKLKINENKRRTKQKQTCNE